MSEGVDIPERLDSWKAIASYVGRDVRTVIRWEQRGGLPVYRVPVGQRQAVYAYRHEIDEWMSGDTPGSIELGAALEVAAARTDRDQALTIAAARPSIPGNGQVRVNARFRFSARSAIWLATIALVVVAAYAVRLVTVPQQIEFTNLTQITSDGANKQGLVTEGHNLFFGESRNGRIVLATIPSGGGTIRVIPDPFVKTIPESISPDGRKLLVLAWDGQEMERALWIIPATRGEPAPVGQVLCHSAAWSPGGRNIAFANGNAISLTNEQGTSTRLVQTFAGIPGLLQWSPDGERLRFQLLDPVSRNSSFWELSFSDQDATSISFLLPMQIAFAGCCDSSSAIDRHGRSFVAGGEFGQSRIRTIARSPGLWGTHFTTRELKQVLSNPSSIVLDSASRQLFAISDSASTKSPSGNHSDDLYWYDRKSGEVRPFLPGISASDVDFSRDGRRITWVQSADQTLWVGGANGTDARQIDFTASGIQLPRWSPDGRQIAFMAKVPGKPWRIFITSPGGSSREASTGTDSQGAPTWSPDGRWLSYGNVWCQESGSCAIHKIDLITGQEVTLPGSEGLETARWSPDGRSIAALRPRSHQIYLFDVRAQRWRRLADGVNGNDLNWSSDSRYLYASNPNGERPNIIRVLIADGSAQSAVDLTSFSSATARIDTWFALAPDDSIIFVRWQQPNEIYAVAYVDK